MNPNFEIENFSTADAEYLKRLGFGSSDLASGLFHENVNQGVITPEVTGIQRLT